MNILSRIFTLLFTFAALSSFGQNIEKYIPANPSIIVQIKPSVLKRSISYEEFADLPMVQNMMQSVQGMLPINNEGGDDFSLSDLGIAADADMYFYANMDDEGSVMAMVMNMSDKQKFTQVVEDMEMGSGAIMSNGNFQTRQNKDQFVSWGDGVAIIGNLSKTPPPYDPYADMDWSEEDYNYEEEIYTDEELEGMEEEEIVVEEIVEAETDEELAEMEEAIEEVMEEEVEEMLTDEDLQAIESPEDAATTAWKNEKLQQTLLPTNAFPTWKKKLVAGTGVISAWMDYGQLMKGMQGAAGGMGGGLPSMSAFTDALYGGMELFTDIQFNQGEAVFKLNFTYPEKWMRGGDITAGKMNGKFKKYIKGDNLMGLYSVAFDMEAYGNMVKAMMIDAMEATPESMGLTSEIAPLLGLFIDEEALYNFIKGDMVVAFTGMKTYEKTTTEYQYDEDFNPIEKQITEEAKIPEFTAMVSYGDRENMQRLFNIGEKLGAISNMGNHYQVMAPLGFDMFLAMHNDILFMSNDTDLITQRLSSGVSGNRISGKQWKAVKKNSFHFFWDLPQSLNMASEFGFPIGEETINMSRESIKEIVWSSPKKQGRTINSDLKLSFVNQQENSLKLILNFFNDLFFEPGTSM